MTEPTADDSKLAPAEVDVTIFPLRRRDLRQVLVIEQAVYPRPWSMGIYLSELSQRESRAYFAAWCDEELVGFGGVMRGVDEAHITTLAVSPKWQGRQIAPRILSTLLRQAIRWQMAAVTLEVRVSNEPGKRLYQRFGFAPVGVRPRYYADSNEDAMIMWLHDVSTPQMIDRLEEIERTIPGNTKVVERRNDDDSRD